MSFDGIVLRAVAHECSQHLTGARIDKIAQPNRHEIVMALRNRSQNYKLLFSTLAQEARVHLTTTTAPNPPQPPLFCMVLRKHLEGGKVLSIRQSGLDRILVLSVQIIDEMGDLAERQLLAEIMGKHSNLVLLDPASRRIIDSIHRVPANISRYRQVLPGLVYTTPPAQDKLPLWEETEDQIGPRLLETGPNKALDKLLLSVYAGIGPQTVQELLHRAGLEPSQTLEFFGQYEYLKLFRSVQNMGNALRGNLYHPEVILQDGVPKAFSAVALTQYPEHQRKAFESVNEMLDFFYRNRSTYNLFRQRQSDLEQVLRREQERCERKAGLQATAIQDAKEAQRWRLYGELLMAHAYDLPQGIEAVVPNYFEPETPLVVIPMDPALTPLQNAQNYFKRYQKAQHTARQAQAPYEETLEELAYLDSVAASLGSVTELSELAEIKEELQEAGYIKAEPVKSAKTPKTGKGGRTSKPGKPAAQPQPGQVTIEGFQILYGKNNRQNDFLTMKIARNGDLWLHTQKIPSAHVIIRNPDRRTIPDSVIVAAAKLCVWNSKARYSSQVPVDYTLRQHVWKPKGAKPGMVLYENYKTLFAAAAEQEITAFLGE